MESLPHSLQDLRQAEERMRSVVNHVVDGIISIDERGTVTTFNPAAEFIFGYAAAEVIGQNVKMLMPEPYQSEHDGYIGNYLRTGQAKIIGIGREVIGKRKDGSTFPMELAISVFWLGDQRHFTGIVRDITDRKRAEEELRQAEERMRSVVNHVVDGIISIDERGQVQSFNPAAERIFGYAAAEVIGQNVKVLMPEPFHSEHDGYLANHLKTGKAKIIGIGREVVGKRKDGTHFPMELAVSDFHIGSARFFTGIVRDITERKVLEQQLRQRVDDLAEADRQKNEFLAMLAHELRNPLAPLRNGLYLLKMPGASAQITEQAREMMDRQLNHLVRLVDDLLDVSRIVRGKIELRKELLDLTTAVTRAIETAQPVIDAQGHVVVLSLPEHPVFVEADLVRMAQILANLLTNAAKYTDRAGRIELSVAEADGRAIVKVRDSGIGIAPHMLPRLFELFVQGDRSLARSQGGLGIGLTLVKRLVELHGGTVTAASAGLGQGSEFTVDLPVATLPEASDAGSARPTATAIGAALKRRILVVDDNVDAAETVGMILKSAGWEVRCVYDGHSVLAAALEYVPDVIVLDIGLPGMTGYEVARQLRRRPEFEHLPLVAVTGYGQDNDRKNAFDAGFNHHLTKPVDPDVLQATVMQSTTTAE
jgi:PAS domain S-box-containing protein